jgi:AraC-like DNA-binding protein
MLAFSHITLPHALARGAVGPSLDMRLVQSMMDAAPGVLFWVKNGALEFQYLNAAMIDHCGAREASQVLGKTSRDFFPAGECAIFEEFDRQVMRTRLPAMEKLTLATNARGRSMWLLVSRWPVTTSSASIVGAASLSRILAEPEKKHQTYARLKAALDYFDANIGAKIEIGQSAERLNVSISQFERDFVDLFGMAPARYVTKLRFQAAIERLGGGESIAAIAHECGYSDQSAFTRRFRAVTGMSPMEFRRKHMPVSLNLMAPNSK